MTRRLLGQRITDPRYANNFLDSCAFDPKYTPEHEAAERIRNLCSDNHINIVIAHSVAKEIEHPNTPNDVKKEAVKMLFSLEVELTQEEQQRLNKIHSILTGNGEPENYQADAQHIFEAGKYVGYFITTDGRILRKQEELCKIPNVPIILKPSEWLDVFDKTA
jgi:predicted nucleic acid-binding protein